MQHIKIRRAEYFTYAKVLVALGILPFLSNAFFSVYNPLFQDPTQRSILLIHFQTAFNLINLVGTAIASAYILNLSEKRKNCRNRFWLALGILFGLTAFLCYIIWGLLKEYKLILPENHNLLTGKKMFRDFLRRLQYEPDEG